MDFSQKFQLGDVADAADVDGPLLRSWVSRGYITLQKDKGDREGKGAGRYRQFSINRALQVAVAARLVKFGLQPRHAATAALAFTDSGSPGNPIRMPGMLFPGARFTALLVPDADSGKSATVLRVDERSHLYTTVPEEEPVLVVPLDPIWHRVVERLGAGAPE
jgi:hypothetical protein